MCQKASEQTSKLKTKLLQTIYDNVLLLSQNLQTVIEIQKTKQLLTIYDNVILGSESLQKDIEIKNDRVTDRLW